MFTEIVDTNFIGIKDFSANHVANSSVWWPCGNHHCCYAVWLFCNSGNVAADWHFFCPVRRKHVVKKFHRDRWYNLYWHQRFVGHILWRIHAYGGLAPTALLLCSVDILQQRKRCRRLTLILSSATKWPAGNAAKMLQINIGLPHRRCIHKTLTHDRLVENVVTHSEKKLQVILLTH